MATTVAVYPRQGTTYPDAEGNEITSTGAIVDISKYITDAISAGYLLTYDPLGVYQPDTRISLGPPAPNTASYVTYGAEAALPNERVLTMGANMFADTTVPGILRISSSGGGGGGGTGYLPNWIVVTEAPYFADPTGVSDSTGAIQAALTAAVSNQTTVFLPAGDYRITDTLYCGLDSNGKEGVHILGQGSARGQYVPKTRLLWDSANSGKPIFWLGGADFTVEQIGFAPKAGRNLYCAIALARQPSEPDIFNSHCVFRGLTMTCENQEDRQMQYGIMIGGSPALDTFTASNFENCVFEDCLIVNCRQSGINFFGGQPINTSIHRTHFVGYQTAATTVRVGGIGVNIGTASFTGSIRDCDFQSLETWVTVANGTHLLISGGESEHCKAAVTTGGPFAQLPGTIEVDNVRCICDRTELASLGPVGLAADFDQFFSINSGMTLILRGNLFLGGDTIPQQFKVTVGSGCPLVSVANSYPNGNPFRMYQDFSGTCRYGIWSSRDSYQNNPANNSSLAKLPERKGGVNPAQLVSISGSNKTAVVVLPESEIDLSYRVEAVVESATWDSVVTLPYVTERGGGGFQVNLTSAPGAGKTVNIRCTPVRDGISAVSDDLAVVLGAVGKWSATSTRRSGGDTAEWRPVIPQLFGSGGGVGAVGSAQDEAAFNANLNNRLAVPFAGTGGYINGTTQSSGTQTIMMVVDLTGGGGTLMELIFNPTPGTGTRISYNGSSVIASRLAVNTSQAFTAGPAVILATFSTAGCSLYVNSLTPTVSGAASGAFDRATLCIGCRIDNTSLFTGAIAELVQWNRILSGGDISTIMNDRAAYYGITLV